MCSEKIIYQFKYNGQVQAVSSQYKMKVYLSMHGILCANDHEEFILKCMTQCAKVYNGESGHKQRLSKSKWYDKSQYL